ncbi:hypothetical protein CK203_087585 [Vitis vinifera]|uniref:Reverse transcriptase Ty1/copia-type domain-containing protein n=1 Tax=Vitis vinifera TaxID=29760 RepID=A0A438EZI6_VITVI|nr:hypothetical protein CK203_087585 [Vitis vinifera]
MEEMQALKKNDTWDIVEQPKGKYPVGCKWAFIIRMLSLNGELDEEVYMALALGFDGGNESGKTDHTLFFKHSQNGKVAILIVYVDDIILTEDDLEELARLEGLLAQEFEIKDLGMLGCKPSKTPIEWNDVDWAGFVDDRKSTTRYCTFVRGNLVTWRSKKQNVVAQNSAKAKYGALAQGTSTISISHNPVHHDRMKHVEQGLQRHSLEPYIVRPVACLQVKEAGHGFAIEVESVVLLEDLVKAKALASPIS